MKTRQGSKRTGGIRSSCKTIRRPTDMSYYCYCQISRTCWIDILTASWQQGIKPVILSTIFSASFHSVLSTPNSKSVYYEGGIRDAPRKNHRACKYRVGERFSLCALERFLIEILRRLQQTQRGHGKKFISISKRWTSLLAPWISQNPLNIRWQFWIPANWNWQT